MIDNMFCREKSLKILIFLRSNYGLALWMPDDTVNNENINGKSGTFESFVNEEFFLRKNNFYEV